MNFNIINIDTEGYIMKYLRNGLSDFFRNSAFKRSLLQLILFSTCSCATNTGIGVMSGGGLGAGFGGIVGGESGALIGSAAGILAGGLIGFGLDEQDRRIISRSSPRTMDRIDKGDPLTLNDVIKLSQNGVSDDAIISYLLSTRTPYDLSQTQIRRLQSSGVSQRVINCMIEIGH